MRSAGLSSVGRKNTDRSSSCYTRLTRQKVFRLYKVRRQLHLFRFRFSDNLSVIGSVVCEFWPLDGGSGSLIWLPGVQRNLTRPSERTVSESKNAIRFSPSQNWGLKHIATLGLKATQLGQSVDECNLNNSMCSWCMCFILFFHSFILLSICVEEFLYLLI